VKYAGIGWVPQRKRRFAGSRSFRLADYLGRVAPLIARYGNGRTGRKICDRTIGKLGPEDPANPKSGLRFIRTIPPDDFVLGKLIAELARRRIPITPETAPDGRVVVTPAHIVILSEWDTPYGRSLDATLTAEASGQTINDVIEQREKPPAWIHSYHYLRGIDGRYQATAAKKSAPARAKISAGSEHRRGRGDRRTEPIRLIFAGWRAR
jgi:hypothetical protein